MFIVHKDILCANSKFFQAACSERWLRSTEAERKIKLPEVDPQVFQGYLSWIYSGELDLSAFTFTQKETSAMQINAARDVAKYVELYLLGDRLDDIGLRNKTMRTLVLETHATARPITANRVWDNTPGNSPIRRMIVDRAIALAPRTLLACSLTKYPKEFVEQVAQLLLQDTPTKDREHFNEKLASYLEQVQEVESNSSD